MEGTLEERKTGSKWRKTAAGIVALIMVLTVAGCSSPEERAQQRRWKNTGEKIAVSKMEEKYDLTDLKVVDSETVYSAGYLVANATSGVRVTLSDGEKDFAVIVDAEDERECCDNYQAEEVHAAIEEVVRANVQGEPEEVTSSYSYGGGEEDMLVRKYDAPKDATATEKQAALREVFGKDWHNLRVTISRADGDDSYIEEEAQHIVCDILDTPMTLWERVFVDRDSYLEGKDEDLSAYRLAPIMTGEVHGTMQTDGVYKSQFDHPNLEQCGDLMYCVEEYDPSEITIQKEDMSQEEAEPFSGNGMVKAVTHGEKYAVTGPENAILYIFVPKEEYPVSKWRMGTSHYFLSRQEPHERLQSVEIAPYQNEVGDYSCFKIGRLKEDEFYFCFLYDEEDSTKE